MSRKSHGMLTAGVALALAVGLVACRRDHAAPAPAAKSSAPSASVALPLRSASAAAPSAASSVAAAGSAQAGAGVRCKALGRKGFVTVGKMGIGDDPVEITARDGAVYVLSFHQPLARASLTRVPRDGSPSTVIGRHTGLGDARGLVLGNQAAYFTRNKSLIRMGLQGGEAAEIAKGVAHAVAVHGEDVYAVACDAKGANDRVVRLKGGAGESETLAELKRPGRSCDYSSMVTDGATAFLADYANLRVIAVGLKDQSVRELATKKTFPGGLMLEPEHVVFQASGGLYRVPRAGGDAARLTELGSTPFFLLAEDPSDFWMYDNQGYTDVQWLYRFPRAGGKEVKVDSFRETAPEMPNNIGVTALTVDDECVYLARANVDPASILARQQS